MADKAHDEPHVDQVSGTATTGHEWDGLRELNNPLPRWWLWVFYATIVFSVGYWVVYPSWPLITTSLDGVFGWHSREAIMADVAALKAVRAAKVDQLAGTDIASVEKDPQLLDFTLAYGRAAFRENCAPCHGAGGGGAVGYANLIDDDWLWGGTITDIQQTITHGIRNDDPKSRQGSMPAWGNGGGLDSGQIITVANYVRSLSGLSTDAGADLSAGAVIFAKNCASCHGAEGKGNREFGAPNLTDGVWLYGSSMPVLIKTITYGRGGSMPAWGDRLDPTTIKALALFVHSLGGGE